MTAKTKRQGLRPVSGRTMLVAGALLIAFWLGFSLRGGADPAAGDANHEHQATESSWTCSMHPQIKLPKAGQCPICFMDLIPLETGSDELGPRTLVLSEAAAALAEIQTAVVAAREVRTALRLVGEVDYDETSLRTISAWVPGRIDELFVDFTGTKVARGERLASLYSPEMYATQSELLNAIAAERDLRLSQDEFVRESAAATVASARERLRLWGLTASQIDRIVARGQAKDHVDITAPVGGVVVHKAAREGMFVQTGTTIYTVADLSRVWVILNAYEADLVWLQEGQTIDFTVEALAGHAFSGRVAFIDPVLNPRTRTVLVRINVDNQEGMLKPGMFVNAVVRAGYTGAAAADGRGEDPLVIPATAPLITGERAVVYVRVPGTDRPTFEGREVVLGPRMDDSYVVVSGLRAGETVVTRGNFKIDSALQIQAKPSMMNPAGGGPLPGHDHGGRAAAPDVVRPSTGMQDHLEVLETPAKFRRQLETVLAAYLAVHEKLAGDDDSGARTAAAKAGKAVSAVDLGLLSGTAHHAWMSDAESLARTFADLAASDDIATRRRALLPATAEVWRVLRRYGYDPRSPVRRFHCPMANDGAGADWLQKQTTTANPYFGASMLRCGGQVDSLVTTVAGEGRSVR